MCVLSYEKVYLCPNTLTYAALLNVNLLREIMKKKIKAYDEQQV